MKQSQLFGKTRKDVSADEVTINAQLLERAGFVEKLTAGVYTYLPLGLRVLEKIKQVVREEINAVGGEELMMPMLHPKENWVKSGGWDGVDVLFKLKSRTEKEYALGQSEEEIVTPLVMKRVQTYRDLPVAVYQIHWKFRDELRSKSGLLRGREFLMKDLYSFHENQEDFDRYYEIVKQGYLKIFSRLGLTAKVTEASGGSFSDKISYEFEVLTDAGEANILYCEACEFCVNVDDITTYHEGEDCPKCRKAGLKAARAAEVGNVFDLGQKYGKSFDLGFIDREGAKQYPVIGCYGIGVSRTMGVLVETFHDDKGIIWPASVAPFQVHLISIRSDEAGEALYRELTEAGIEVLWDDRDMSPGQKFADADLIGIPVRLVVSEKTLATDSVEWKRRSSDDTELVKRSVLLKRLSMANSEEKPNE